MPAKSTLSYSKSICVNRNNQYSSVGNTRQALPFWRIVFIRMLYGGPGPARAAPGQVKHQNLATGALAH